MNSYYLLSCLYLAYSVRTLGPAHQATLEPLHIFYIRFLIPGRLFPPTYSHCIVEPTSKFNCFLAYSHFAQSPLQDFCLFALAVSSHLLKLCPAHPYLRTPKPHARLRLACLTPYITSARVTTSRVPPRISCAFAHSHPLHLALRA
jgi:hypothetical protein